MDLKNVENAGHGLIATRCHRLAVGCEDEGPAMEKHVGALLTDLMHYCDAQGLLWDECMKKGLEGYLDQTLPAEKE